MNILGRLNVAALIVATVAAAPASAADFIFSFSSDCSDCGISNAVTGTVTGRILGVIDNGTSSAVSVFIDGYTASGFSEFPTDAAKWSQQFSNSFTVTNGSVTVADFHADTNSSSGLNQLFINVPIGYLDGNTNYASTGVGNVQSIWNNKGLAGVTFTPLVAEAVPEPSTWAMMLAGFGMIGLAVRRRQQVKTTVTYA